MARLSWADIRKRINWENNLQELLGPLATGTNADGTPFTLPITGQVDTNKAQGQLAAEQAKFYFAGSGRLSLSVAGNIRGTLTNPATETTNIHVVRLAGLGTSATWASLRINPTTGLPASAARRVNNNILHLGGDNSQLKVDTDATVALSGGTDTGVALGIPNATRFSIDFNVPMVIAPGQALGIAVPFTGAADMSFSVYWYRTPS